MKHPIIISAPVRLQKFPNLAAFLIKSMELLNPAFPSLKCCTFPSGAVSLNKQRDAVVKFAAGNAKECAAQTKNVISVAEETCEL
jgi:hypothetical protein